MLRDPSLRPLSRQHQHALALCVRIERTSRTGKLDLEAWQAELQQIFELEIQQHFAAEEREIFPAAARFSSLEALVKELIAEHGVLRNLFTQAGARRLDGEGIRRLAMLLEAHIRREERQLFEGMQQMMGAEELAAIGKAVDTMLEGSGPACALPPKGSGSVRET